MVSSMLGAKQRRDCEWEGREEGSRVISTSAEAKPLDVRVTV